MTDESRLEDPYAPPPYTREQFDEVLAEAVGTESGERLYLADGLMDSYASLLDELATVKDQLREAREQTRRTTLEAGLIRGPGREHATDACWCGHEQSRHRWDPVRDYRELVCDGCRPEQYPQERRYQRWSATVAARLTDHAQSPSHDQFDCWRCDAIEAYAALASTPETLVGDFIRSDGTRSDTYGPKPESGEQL